MSSSECSEECEEEQSQHIDRCHDSCNGKYPKDRFVLHPCFCKDLVFREKSCKRRTTYDCKCSDKKNKIGDWIVSINEIEVNSKNFHDVIRDAESQDKVFRFCLECTLNLNLRTNERTNFVFQKIFISCNLAVFSFLKIIFFTSES